MERSSSGYASHRLWLDVFVLLSLAFLGPDIYLAHATNLFRSSAEYWPLVFSPLAALVVLAALAMLWTRSSLLGWRILGYLVGWAAVALGVVGLLFHLESRFFHENTLESLVYTAPFAAPLASTGLGLLLIMNRMVDPEAAEWPYWVLPQTSAAPRRTYGITLFTALLPWLRCSSRTSCS